MEREDSLKSELERLAAEADEGHGEECCCHDHGHHHDHEHGHDECCHHDHEHEHDHEHGHEHEHHHHHHGHDADEVFTSWGAETARKFTEEEIVSALSQLCLLYTSRCV